MKKFFAIALLVVGAAALYPQIRALSPYPRNYESRLRWLVGYTNFNCAGFIENAHGDATLKTIGTMHDPKYYRDGANGRLSIVANRIDYSVMRAGDVVTFANGEHVTAYLGDGIFVDSDFRRGNVATWQLNSKIGDNYFQGAVRVLRWRQ